MSDKKTALQDAAKSLIARKGWVRSTVPEIATEAGISIVDALRIAPNKAVLVAGTLDEVDARLAADPDRAQAGSDMRNAIFAAIMTYVDQLQAERAYFSAVVQGLRFDPIGSAIIAARFEQSLDTILDHAGLSANLVAGFARRRAVGVLMLEVLRVWADDDSDDLSGTMAALNNRLTQIEGLIQSALGAALTVAAKVQQFRGGADADAAGAAAADQDG